MPVRGSVVGAKLAANPSAVKVTPSVVKPVVKPPVIVSKPELSTKPLIPATPAKTIAPETKAVGTASGLAAVASLATKPGAEIVDAPKSEPAPTPKPLEIAKVPTLEAPKVAPVEVMQKSEVPLKQEVTPTKSASKSNDPGCQLAEGEAKRGVSAANVAEKLYYYRKAVRHCPNNVSYHVEIAKAYKAIGRDKEAEGELMMATQLEPNNSEAKGMMESIKSAK